MIYFTQQIKYYLSDVNEIFCCNCFFEKVFFLIKEKKLESISIEEEVTDNTLKIFNNFEEEIGENILRFFDGTLVYTCFDFLEFLYSERNILNLISCKDYKEICSICYVELSRKLKILNRFYKKENVNY